jgi:DNA-binding transcriptional LysR family regulator
MVNFDRLDLNLLRVFDAVMEDRSVVKAGQRLHLSQSAISHALTRLKESLGQEIFVRTAKGMTPTAFALEISGPLRMALGSIAATLAAAAADFDASSVKRSFVVAANDYVSAILVPHFNRYLSEKAPGIDLIIRPSTRIDLAEQIDLGRIDIAIGTFRSIPERFRSNTLMLQDEVLLVWKDHPVARRELLLEDLVNYPIAVVSLGGPQDGAVSGFILERGLARQSEMYDRAALENALRELNAEPRLQLIIPHFLVIPMLLENSDLVSIVPRPLAHALFRRYPLTAKELPYPRTPWPLNAVWHSNAEADPAQMWLRARLTEAVQAITEHMATQ